MPDLGLGLLISVWIMFGLRVVVRTFSGFGVSGFVWIYFLLIF